MPIIEPSNPHPYLCTTQATCFAESFYTIPANLQKLLFFTYPLEQQYELVVFHPDFHSDRIVIKSMFAMHGSAIVPFLKQKLKETENEKAIADIVSIFDFLNAWNMYSVAADAELFSLLKKQGQSKWLDKLRAMPPVSGPPRFTPVPLPQ